MIKDFSNYYITSNKYCKCKNNTSCVCIKENITLFKSEGDKSPLVMDLNPISFDEFDSDDLAQEVEQRELGDDTIEDYIDEVPFKNTYNKDSEIYCFDSSYISSPTNCSIVKCLSDQGLRIAIMYTNDIDNDLETLCGNLTINDAIEKASEYSVELSLPVYNQKTEEYIGAIPDCLVIKNDLDKSTSYKK